MILVTHFGGGKVYMNRQETGRISGSTESADGETRHEEDLYSPGCDAGTHFWSVSERSERVWSEAEPSD
jgi:hypothetical protein